MWKYEALCIAVEYVLREEGAGTCNQLSQRIGVNTTHLRLVLRNLVSRGTIKESGRPRIYEFVR